MANLILIIGNKQNCRRHFEVGYKIYSIHNIIVSVIHIKFGIHTYAKTKFGWCKRTQESAPRFQDDRLYITKR